MIGALPGPRIMAPLDEVTDIFSFPSMVLLEAAGQTLTLQAPRTLLAPFVDRLSAARELVAAPRQPASPPVQTATTGGTALPATPIGGAQDPRPSPAITAESMGAAHGAPTGRRGRWRSVAASFLVGVVVAIPLGLLAPLVAEFLLIGVTGELTGTGYRLPASLAPVITWVVWISVPTWLTWLTWSAWADNDRYLEPWQVWLRRQSREGD